MIRKYEKWVGCISTFVIVFHMPKITNKSSENSEEKDARNSGPEGFYEYEREEFVNC